MLCLTINTWAITTPEDYCVKLESGLLEYCMDYPNIISCHNNETKEEQCKEIEKELEQK